MIMIDKNQIIAFIRENGPSLPSEIKTRINIDLIYISAILSEMVRSKELFMTFAKIGGSPLYYLPDQKEQIQRVADYLKGPEKEIFQKLKENKILKDSSLSPVEKVAIRKIPDFAKPIKITINNSSETFWKWYLTTNEEIKEIIKNKENNRDVKQNSRPEEKSNNEKIEVKRNEDITEPKEKTENTNTPSANQDRLFKEPNINIIKDIKIDHNFIEQTIARLGISLNKNLLNSNGFAIFLADYHHIPICIGFHARKTLKENDIMMFYGYSCTNRVQGVLVLKESSVKKTEEILRKLKIKVYSYQYNNWVI